MRLVLEKGENRRMETLQILEQRITQLISLVKKLQEENSGLIQEHSQVLEKLEFLERSMLQDNNDLEKLNKEREQAKHTVDELIKSIDTLVGEKQQL